MRKVEFNLLWYYTLRLEKRIQKKYTLKFSIF